MKICHVSYSTQGGAGIAAGRLHRSLREHGVTSEFLAVQTDGSDDALPIGSRRQRQRMRLAQHLTYRSYKLARSINDSGHGFELFASGLGCDIEARHADIVHLHGIAGEMLSIGEIGALCRKLPVVWTFHDAWPYTGTEQYYIPGSAPRYKDGYRRGNNENRGLDLDRWYWRLKYRHWRGMPCRIVAPSEYLAAQIRESVIFQGRPVTVIPHGLEPAQYAPGDREEACRRLGIAPDRRYVGVAMADATNRIKGGDRIVELLATGELQAQGYTLLIAGRNFPPELATRRDVCYAGALSESQMRDFFRASELFFNPTRLESFGLTNLEAMACGTPVLSTFQSAIPEVVTHRETGYLAQPESMTDYLAGLDYVVSHRAELAANAVRRVREHFAIATMTERYRELYTQLLASSSAGVA